MAYHVGRIFKERPESWGYRGDPYLWEDLEKHFSTISIPLSEEDFIMEMHLNFEKLTGSKLESDDNIHISRYSHGGMSSGMISQEYWHKNVLPMLIQRLHNANRK
ncbi:hypothetical protein [Neobacillus drentensis]|uniref:hypothetical protein n=1 Tax=Neobacillus drentensis TaxID=220684 RepID=UPI00285E8E41|nr:hypothetical protein [Neobacillus drentensis]MDR7240513.1 hypothetical protein [Neobacillus drentensis]